MTPVKCQYFSLKIIFYTTKEVIDTDCLQVFLSLGSNFTLQLLTVMLVSGRFYGMPKILQEAKSTVLPVPEKAANSQVMGPGCVTVVEPLEGSFHRKD